VRRETLLSWPEFISDLAMAFLAFSLVVRTFVMDLKPLEGVSSVTERKRRKTLKRVAEGSLVPILLISGIAYVVALVLRKL